MKTLRRTILTLGLVLAAHASAETALEFQARAKRLDASPKELRVLVVDEEGRPLVGAKGNSINYQIKTGKHDGDHLTTDEAGVMIFRDPPYRYTTDLRVKMSETRTAIGWEAYDIDISDAKFLRINQPLTEIRLTLPSVLHPIPLKAKSEVLSHRRVNSPKDGMPVDPRLPDLAVTEIGYDAELLEPMPPHGNGKRVDFIVKITSTFLGFKDALHERRAVADFERGNYTMSDGKVRHGNWTHSATYRFPNKGDGVLLSPQFWPYCKLKMPHKAPEDGYTQEITLTETQDNSGIRPDLAHCRERMVNNGLYLRVRTQLDKDGNVVSANYAKIVGPQGSGFDIFYNPTPNDRNLEYDLKTNLRWQELHPLSKEPPPWNSPYDVKSN